MNHLIALIHFHNIKYFFKIHDSGHKLFTDSWDLQSEEKTLYGQVNDAMLGGLRPALIYQVIIIIIIIIIINIITHHIPDQGFRGERAWPEQGGTSSPGQKTSIKFNFHLTTFQNILQQTVIYLDTLPRLSILAHTTKVNLGTKIRVNFHCK